MLAAVLWIYLNHSGGVMSERKDFDLFRAIIVMTISCILIAAILTIDYTGAIDFNGISEKLNEDLQLKNWHYAVLVILLWIGRNKE